MPYLHIHDGKTVVYEDVCDACASEDTGMSFGYLATAPKAADDA